MGQFDGKVAVLTGAGVGIGRISAHMLSQEGAQVVIAELKPELGLAAEAAIKAAGGKAMFIQTDSSICDGRRGQRYRRTNRPLERQAGPSWSR